MSAAVLPEVARASDNLRETLERFSLLENECTLRLDEIFHQLREVRGIITGRQA